VAVNSSVGRGVSDGGSGVKVGRRVDCSSGARIAPAGWNGVEVGNAFGLAVTITSVGGAEFEVGREHAVSKRQNAKRKT